VKEKELRFALVVYGGVSLAVYMHGVTKEILKLVRASRDYHDFTARGLGAGGYDLPGYHRADPVDSERIYFELLRQIGSKLDLRVVVDIIAGASAGGINGVILARALAHDLNIDPVRDFWLKHSDVAELMPTHVKAGRWSKWYLRPFVSMMLWRIRGDIGAGREIRQKLSMFLRSRWFKPPFDGYNLTKVLFGGFSAMGDPQGPGSSLVPSGLQLDLFVTVTDFYGYVTDTPIHDPPVVRDREHRQVIRMSYRDWPKGHESSGFDRENLPGLVFAARATSSFPGAFPPMQFREIDGLIAEHGLAWRSRVDFLYQNFRPYLLAHLNPAEAAFIDGSVLNNKPFAKAIDAIGGRPAYRHVDRRLLYIDPHPKGAENRQWGRVPGWFETWKGALSDIPRNEPIHDDLSWVNKHNAEVRRLQTVIESARSHIHSIALSLAGDALDGPLTGEGIGRFREMANNRARAETGFAYEGYLRLKLTAVIEDVAGLVAEISGHAKETADAQRLVAVVQCWAVQCGAMPSAAELSRPATAGELPVWVRFLLRFDVRYRQRRIRFVVRAVNQLYMRLNEPAFAGLTTQQLDRIKAGLYDALALLQPMAGRSIGVVSGPRGVKLGLSLEATETVKAVARDIAAAGSLSSDQVALQFAEPLSRALDMVGTDLALEGDNTRTDALIVALVDGVGNVAPLPLAARRELLEHYIGFAVWDVLTFSVTNWRDLDEFDEIRVDRLSPDDSQTLRQGGASATLKGIQFGHFGAFFSLSYRQNDYLWGRLHAAERLIDIVLDAANIEGAADGIDKLKLKKDIFRAILATEASNLGECTDLINQLLRDTDNLTASRPPLDAKESVPV